MKARRTLSVFGTLVLLLSLGASPPGYAQGGGTTTRVSVSSDGTQGNGDSRGASLSADGRYVAFSSRATNLVPDDANGAEDVFIHDRQTGVTARVSVSSDGSEGDGDSLSLGQTLSADGRYVAFDSDASNLVPGDTNGTFDVFVHDRQTGQTTRVSIASDGTEGNGFSGAPALSGDGRYVSFYSEASNLVPSDNNNDADIFVYDRQTGETRRVSVASDDTEGNRASKAPLSLSADGRYVAFYSWASNLVPEDTNQHRDVFVHDLQTGSTTRVSIASDGSQGSAESWDSTISADGRYVAFRSSAGNLVGVDTCSAGIFLHDRQTRATTRVAYDHGEGEPGNCTTRWSLGLSLSADGRYLAFQSSAESLVWGDTNEKADIFLHDLQTRTTVRMSVATGGTQAAGGSYWPSLSADGRFVAFESAAANLVPGDTNGVSDVFVHEWISMPAYERILVPLAMH